MSAQVDRWVEERLADAPPALRKRMLAALRAAGAARAPDDGHAHAAAAHLRDVGERLLAEAASGPPSVDTALTLLAADGFATLACELLAEADAAALGEAS